MSTVALTIDGRVATLTLSRPKALNAINGELLADYETAVEQVRSSDTSVLVTCGEGRAFSAGSDLKELADKPPQEAAKLEREHGRVFALLDDLPQITVAKWHGHVLGGGMFVGVYHDFRIATADVNITLPEVAHGWTPPWGVSRLVELVGVREARRLMLTDCRLDGDAAQRIGLVDAVAGDEWIEALAARPPEALAQTKALLREMRGLDHEHFDDRAARAFQLCYATDAAREAVERFLKRS